MTETEPRPVSRGDYSNGISIETSKVVQGMGLVFSGALKMLEAIHPKISVDPAELMCLVTGDKDGLALLTEMRKAEDAEKTAKTAKTEEPKEETHETENAGAGTVAIPTDGPVAAVSDAHGDDDTADDVTKKAPEPAEDQKPTGNRKPAEDQKSTKPVTTLTQDDITKVIVKKIKANRSNNEKIGRLLKTYGTARVSDLPASKYEAFITDLAAI